MTIKSKFFYAILFCLILKICETLKADPYLPQASPSKSPSLKTEVKDAVAATPLTIIKFLAGISQGGEFLGFENQSWWQEYRLSFDQSWSAIEKGRLEPMKLWRDRYLGSVDLPVLYPMGGPDVFNVLTFFPNSPEYILVGLERIGSLIHVPELQKVDHLKRLANNLKQGLASLFQRSFFITHDMSKDFYERGVVSTLLVLLTRLDCKIESVKLVNYTSEGNIIETPQNTWSHGVEIVFQKNETQAPPQKLYYFRQNLHNHHIKPFADFIKARDKFAVMFKSSSYTPHQVGFSQLVQLVEDCGELILQDDSGLPYKDLKKNWNIEIYGSYTRPYGESFQAYYQPHLETLYKENSDPGSLDFRIGYGYGKVPSNMQIARRKKKSCEEGKVSPKTSTFMNKMD